MSSKKNTRSANVMRREIMAAIKDVVGLKDQLALSIANDVADRLQRHWGGREVYFSPPDSEGRNQSIRAAFNGRNHAQVCEQFKISMRTFYRIISQ